MKGIYLEKMSGARFEKSFWRKGGPFMLEESFLSALPRRLAASPPHLVHQTGVLINVGLQWFAWLTFAFVVLFDWLFVG